MASPELVCNIQAEDFASVSSSLGPFYGFHSSDSEGTVTVEDPGQIKAPEGVLPAAPFSGSLDYASKYDPTIVRKVYQSKNFYRNTDSSMTNNESIEDSQVPMAFSSRTPFTLRGRMPAYKVEIGSEQEKANSKGT